MTLGLCYPLIVARTKTVFSLIILLSTDWVAFFARIIIALPIFLQYEDTRSGLSFGHVFYKFRLILNSVRIKPPRGMSIVRFRMVNLAFESVAQTVGASQALILAPIAYSLSLIAPDKNEGARPIFTDNSDGSKSFEEYEYNARRTHALLYDFLFPEGSLSVIFLVCVGLQTILQDRFLHYIYSEWFGQTSLLPLLDGWPDYKRTRIVLTWNAVCPVVSLSLANSAMIAMLEESGPFKREGT